MKQLVLVSLMLIAGRVLGQTTAAQSNPFLMKIDEMGRVLPNVGKDNVKGFPFLHEVTAKGWVKLKNGNRVSGFDLQVDLYNNALYFIFNGQYYQFAEPVAECQLAFPDNDDSLRYQFRSGYPVFRDRPATPLCTRCWQMGPAINCSITSAKTKWILLPTAPPSTRSTSKPANGTCMMYKHNSCNLCRRKLILRLSSVIHCWPLMCNRQASPKQNRIGWLYWITSIRMSDVRYTPIWTELV